MVDLGNNSKVRLDGVAYGTSRPVDVAGIGMRDKDENHETLWSKVGSADVVSHQALGGQAGAGWGI